MDTFKTDNQFGLSTPKSRDEFEVPIDPLLGQILEIINLAVEEIGRHEVATPTGAVVELSVASTVDTEPTSGLDVDEALRNVEYALKYPEAA